MTGKNSGENENRSNQNMGSLGKKEKPRNSVQSSFGQESRDPSSSSQDEDRKKSETSTNTPSSTGDRTSIQSHRILDLNSSSEGSR